MALPFKSLTADNWQEQDPVGRNFVKVSRATGHAEPMSGDDWAELFLRPKLAETVPADVEAIFEAGRGALLYGYFFYPMYALGLDQLYRAGEAALGERFTQEGGPRSHRTFEARINWLRDQHVLDAYEAKRWHATRQLRNITSHPTFQHLHAPGEVAGQVANLALRISSLFT